MINELLATWIERENGISAISLHVWRASDVVKSEVDLHDRPSFGPRGSIGHFWS